MGHRQSRTVLCSAQLSVDKAHCFRFLFAMSDLQLLPHRFQLFQGVPAGLIFCLGVRRSGLVSVQANLSVLPVRFGQSICCLDGVNGFDPYPFAQASRHVGGAVSDDEIRSILNLIRVSRSFTIHQLRASVDWLLPDLLGISPKPLVVILGIEYLFLEESLPLWEREYHLRKIMERLQSLRDQGLPILVTHEPGQESSWWQPILTSSSDWMASLQDSPADTENLVWTKPRFKI